MISTEQKIALQLHWRMHQIGHKEPIVLAQVCTQTTEEIETTYKTLRKLQKSFKQAKNAYY